MNKTKKETKKKSNILIYFLLITSLIIIYSLYIEPNNLIVKEYKIENKSLPNSFDGLKIVHFSDIHYGSTVNLKYLKKIVNLINKQNPDLVIFTGDFLDKRYNLDNKEIENIKKELKNINSKLGKYAVSGNHDMVYKKDFINIITDSFTLLDNEEKLIYYKETEPISLVGLSDARETKVDYKALETENNYFRFVIAHEPDEYDKINNYNFNILLSGHSHNGQIKIPIIGVIYEPPGAKTYYNEYYNLDNKEIFVSNGIGTSGINMRFNSTPSINLYRLYAQ